MLESIKQILKLAKKTRYFWLIPLLLFLVIVVLLIVVSAISPVPVFIYPLI